MGWEAIEQYLTEVEREATHSEDQQVPQMSLEGSPVMLNSATDTRVADLLAEDLPFAGPRPTYVAGPGETLISREEEVSYCDLDQDSQSLYHCENVFKYTQKGTVMDSSAHYTDTCEIQRPIKSEYYDDYICQIPDYYSPEEQDQGALSIVSKVLYECAEDVNTTCKCLKISTDPAHWSPQNVQDWVTWQCKQFSLPVPTLDFFWVPGSDLCRWSEQDFKMCAPEVTAQTLFSRLDVWRNVVEQTTQRGWSDCGPRLTQIPVPASPGLSLSPGRSSPTPSSWSDENLPESPKMFSTAIQQDKDRLPDEPVHHHRQTIQLWQFLKLLLVDPSGNYKDCIRWVDRARGVFKIENSNRVAKLWGKRKNRPAMNYDKLSRSIRQYYKKGIIKKTEQSKRLVYQFCQP